MDLKLPGETQPVFKSVLETKTLENVLINHNQKFSDNTASSQTTVLVTSQERFSAFDSSTNNRNIIIYTNIIHLLLELWTLKRVCKTSALDTIWTT